MNLEDLKVTPRIQPEPTPQMKKISLLETHPFQPESDLYFILLWVTHPQYALEQTDPPGLQACSSFG